MRGAGRLAAAIAVVWVFSGCGSLGRRNYHEPPSDSYTLSEWKVTTDSFSEQVEGAAVSPEFFPASKALPYLGRFFYVEDHASGLNVVVLSHDLWQRRFGAKPDVIGRQIELNGRSAVIIGVGPPEFTFPSGAEVWAPKT